MLEAALRYRKQFNWSVVPLKRGTKDRPLIKWAEFQGRLPEISEIIDWWTKWPDANIAVVTGKISGLMGIDHDIYKPDYKHDEVMKYIPESLVTPTVLTPQGGHHQYFACPEGEISIKAGLIPGLDYRCEGGFLMVPPSVNGNGRKYAWVVPPEKGKFALVPDAILDLIKDNNKYIRGGIIRGGVEKSVENNTTEHYKHYKILQEGKRDEDLFHVANQLIRGGRGEDFTRQVLEILAKSCTPPFPEKEMELKIKSALERVEKRERNLAEEVKEFCLLQEGYINTTDILQTLQITTKEEKKNLTVILSRLNNEGILEKYGEKRGCYRPVIKKAEAMNLKSESFVTDVPVRLPLELNSMCVLSPGNIIMVAGSKSAGKTAFVMNVAAFNQNDFNVHYLNSEMSESEFKKRMKKFMPLKDWNITGHACHNNFEDYIVSDPKNLYIIDFLEIHDNFYEIAKPIRRIHEKLGDSLCFIALHMKLGNTLGRGGDFSAEKARLYLTMDYVESIRQTKVTIYDAKEPRPPHDSVRGMHRMVKIINGSDLHFSPQDNWKW